MDSPSHILRSRVAALESRIGTLELAVAELSETLERQGTAAVVALRQLEPSAPFWVDPSERREHLILRIWPAILAALRRLQRHVFAPADLSSAPASSTPPLLDV